MRTVMRPTSSEHKAPCRYQANIKCSVLSLQLDRWPCVHVLRLKRLQFSYRIYSLVSHCSGNKHHSPVGFYNGACETSGVNVTELAVVLRSVKKGYFQTRSSAFWDVTQCKFVVSYRRFGTI
jgi:hypothetical protein